MAGRPLRADKPLPLSDKSHTLSFAVVFDASTLILLAKSDLLDLFLEDFEGSTLLPGAVEAESTGFPGRPDGVLIRQRISEGRLTVEEVGQSNVLARLARDFRLGAGEAEALALALERGDSTLVATDDRNAIRACKVLRIRFVTSLGILVRAVEKDLLSPEDGARCLERLRSYGRFKGEVIEEVLRQIGGVSYGKGSKNG